jgi:hypothetical protein
LVIAAGARVVTCDETTVIPIAVSPSSVNLESEGVWVSVHADIPYAAVATADLTLNGLEVSWTKADTRGELVAKFALDDVKSIIAPPSAVLTLAGFTKDGLPFSGTDTIKVVQEGGNR